MLDGVGQREDWEENQNQNLGWDYGQDQGWDQGWDQAWEQGKDQGWVWDQGLEDETQVFDMDFVGKDKDEDQDADWNQDHYQDSHRFQFGHH